MSVEKVAKDFLKFAFDAKNDMRICDYIGFVWYVAASSNKDVLDGLMEITETPSAKHRVLDIRDRLKDIRQRASNQLQALANIPQA